MEPIATAARAPAERGSPNEILVDAIQTLARVEAIGEIASIVPATARKLVGADGATLVIRDGEFCDYVAEDASAPVLQGIRLPIDACVEGWTMLHRAPATIEDVGGDPRIPSDTYSSGTVTSLAVVPIRPRDPLGAIGAYWSARHLPTDAELSLLHSLADATSVAIDNQRLRAMLVDDELTGLASRRGFFEQAEPAFERAAATETESAVAIVEIDDLEQVNRDHGPEVGSELTRDVAGALRSVAAPGDILGRLDGDELALFRPFSNGSADDLYREITVALEALDLERPYPVATSAGVVALAAAARGSLDGLLACAGELVYARKRAVGKPVARRRERV